VLERQPKTMSSAFFCTEICGTGEARCGTGIADGPVFEDEVNFDLEELEARSAS
jgi:hypothetical protein